VLGAFCGAPGLRHLIRGVWSVRGSEIRGSRGLEIWGSLHWETRAPRAGVGVSGFLGLKFRFEASGSSFRKVIGSKGLGNLESEQRGQSDGWGLCLTARLLGLGQTKL
jgi:hypothetical protein